MIDIAKDIRYPPPRPELAEGTDGVLKPLPIPSVLPLYLSLPLPTSNSRTT